MTAVATPVSGGSPADGALARDVVLAAHRLTADLATAKPVVYWGDLALSCLLGYGALVAAAMTTAPWLTLGLGLVSTLALYRAVLFIHELTHIRRREVPHFHFGWNVLVGVPLLMPSFFYEGVHNLHHAKSRYGTIKDPEYLPLGHRPWWHIVTFLVVSPVLPLLLLVRFTLLTPLAALVPAARRLLMARGSSLAINPEFVREEPTKAQKPEWLAQEIVTTLWAWALVGLVATGVLPLRGFLVALAVAAGISFVNQLRTLVAHHWENEGDEMDPVAQLLDTVNVPPPATLPALWAPVGLRYHALHHLLPGLPYHSLGEAHRRLMELLPADAPYRQTSAAGMREVVARLLEHSRTHAPA